jgi:hypothetical protein
VRQGLIVLLLVEVDIPRGNASKHEENWGGT